MKNKQDMFKFKDFPEDKLKKLRIKVNKKFNKPSIEGVYYKKLKTFKDERGDLTELWSLPWSKAEPIKSEVKHIYFNTTHEGVVKGFHIHEHTFSQYTCVKGKMQVLLIDLRSDSKTYSHLDQFLIGSENPSYIKIPPGVLKAWRSVKGDSIIVNLLTTADVEDNYKYPPDLILQDLWLRSGK